MVACPLNSAYVFIKKNIKKRVALCYAVRYAANREHFYISLYFLNSSMRHPNYNGLMSLGE
jgi:hypothetical protein